MNAARRGLSLLAAIAGIVAMALSLAVSSAQADAGKTGSVKEVIRAGLPNHTQSGSLLYNTYTQKCLAFQGSNLANGAPAFQYDCVGYLDQEWEFEWLGGGTVRIRNTYTHKCLAFQGSNLANGAPAFQYDCVGYQDQEWFVDSAFDGVTGAYLYSIFTNAFTHKCLAVQGSNLANGAPAFQYDCGLLDQRWYIF